MAWEERSACLALVRSLTADGATRSEAQRHVTTMFYPHVPRGMSRRYNKRLYAAAVAVCGACSVRAECLADAVDTEDFRGVRGGLDPYQLLDLMGYQGRIPA